MQRKTVFPKVTHKKRVENPMPGESGHRVSRRPRFRPCIDLHQGKVKQIVGKTLTDDAPETLSTNFVANKPARWYARLYRKDRLDGGHIILLGPGNRPAARAALGAWPNGFQIGGGVTRDNAGDWLDLGAAAVIVTSWVFHNGVVDEARLHKLSSAIGKNRLTLDLSCRRREGEYFIVTNRWQTFTKEKITPKLLDRLSGHCFEFLIHGVDQEGKCQGIEEDLVEMLGNWSGIPVTYAGGIRSFNDIDKLNTLGKNAVDFTVGSALDIFGGNKIAYRDLVGKYGPTT